MLQRIDTLFCPRSFQIALEMTRKRAHTESAPTPAHQIASAPPRGFRAPAPIPLNPQPLQPPAKELQLSAPFHGLQSSLQKQRRASQSGARLSTEYDPHTSAVETWLVAGLPKNDQPHAAANRALLVCAARQTARRLRAHPGRLPLRPAPPGGDCQGHP